MPFGVVSGVGLGSGVLDFGGYREGEGTVWRVNLGRPIVTNGDFVASLCGIAIELSFGLMSGVGPSIHVLDGSPRASRGRGCFWHSFWRFANFSSNTLQWRHMDTLTY